MPKVSGMDSIILTLKANMPIVIGSLFVYYGLSFIIIHPVMIFTKKQNWLKIRKLL